MDALAEGLLQLLELTRDRLAEPDLLLADAPEFAVAVFHEPAAGAAAQADQRIDDEVAQQ